MHKKKRKDSTCVVKKNGKIVGYITAKDEAKGLDIKLNTQGYEIIAL
ncbi:hypothetical protein [Enterococcus gallinarum]|nr:hypothetical protein [Enterococcus gallinarum]HAQ0366269.1 hypothetical protein [Enterococcus faecium]